MKKVTKGKEKSIKKLKKEAAKSTLDAASNAILDHPAMAMSPSSIPGGALVLPECIEIPAADEALPLNPKAWKPKQLEFQSPMPMPHSFVREVNES